MPNKIKIICLVLCLVAIVFANRIIAKDSSPGGIYIIGPDVSPDSASYDLLYYSQDAGTTLVIRDTLLFPGMPPIPDVLDYNGIAADCSVGIVYVGTDIHDGLFFLVQIQEQHGNREAVIIMRALRILGVFHVKY